MQDIPQIDKVTLNRNILHHKNKDEILWGNSYHLVHQACPKNNKIIFIRNPVKNQIFEVPYNCVTPVNWQGKPFNNLIELISKTTACLWCNKYDHWDIIKDYGIRCADKNHECSWIMNYDSELRKKMILTINVKSVFNGTMNFNGYDGFITIIGKSQPQIQLTTVQDLENQILRMKRLLIVS